MSRTPADGENAPKRGTEMNQKEIFALMDRFDAGRAVRLRLTSGDFTIELSKAAPAVPGPAPRVDPEPVPSPAPAEEGAVITAPLVGTFYASPAPGEAPFVRPGQRVEKGQTVCILEAMKMMSEVPAPRAGTILEVLAEDGALVSFGEPLIRYREG